jgi:hypothetical protein
VALRGGGVQERLHRVEHVIRQLAAGAVRAVAGDRLRHVGDAEAAAVFEVAVRQRDFRPVENRKIGYKKIGDRAEWHIVKRGSIY